MVRKKIILSIDVEEWFMVENYKEVIDQDLWDSLESRLEIGVSKILSALSNVNVKATFFVLGWISDRYPSVVRNIYENGHEIASHGYYHKLNNTLTEDELYDDILKSKISLEGIIKEDIIGYRAPSFTITEDLVNVLIRLGFLYDSSFHDVSYHDRYSKIKLDSINFDKLLEFKIRPLKIFGFSFPIAGGGYFRLLPYWLFRFLFKMGASTETPVFYIHPWEFDAHQPTPSGVSILRKLRHRIGLNKTERKLIKLVRDFECISFKDYMEDKK